MNQHLAAYERHRNEANAAFSLYVDHCQGIAPPRVAGMDTIIRLAWRIHCGRTVEQAAAGEYLYRWRLAIKAPDQCIGAMTRNPCVSIFGTPHTIGL
jgi:hypothetical protein